ncbi:MAG: glycosyltransferase [Candidatus Cloacimonetes bacterium]|nr:glycosyltransferase [Candidatus Cloacimonadota bacterium]
MIRQHLRVLFVLTGNKKDLSYIFVNQLESLAPALADYKVFTVQGKGLRGYLRNLLPLRREIKAFQPDLIHAHYSLCGYLSSLTGFKPIVVSLMGSDCRKGLSIFLIRCFHNLVWSFAIVKSQEMQAVLNLKHRIKLIPNGVDLGKFPFIGRMEACAELGFDPAWKYIIFIANPQRPEKNYALALEAVSTLAREDLRLFVVPNNTPHERINLYLRASSVLLLTSIYEGSPNVVKEAMACDLPIVSTAVGDVPKNIGGLPGCYVTSYSVKEVASALNNALLYEGPTQGRQRLLDLGLDATTVSRSILEIYANVAAKRQQGA